MSYLTDREKRLLFSALSREKKVCEEVDRECCREPYETPLKRVVEDLERKFYYDRFEKEIRNKTIEKFTKKLNEKCNSMIAEKWNSEVAPMSWANAYADFKDDIDEIARQMKEVEE